MNEGKILQINNQDNIPQNPTKEREWSVKLSSEVVKLIKDLADKEHAIVVDCGAGEGRHSVYALEQGVGKVISIERDAIQNEILKLKSEQNNNLEVRGGDTFSELEKFDNDSINCIIDCGMSHYFKTQEDRVKFAELVKEKLKKGGLYSITHFSENEIAAKNLTHANLEDLKSLFPDTVWDDSSMPWKEESWESGGNKHFAYKAVLRKK